MDGYCALAGGNKELAFDSTKSMYASGRRSRRDSELHRAGPG